ARGVVAPALQAARAHQGAVEVVPGCQRQGSAASGAATRVPGIAPPATLVRGPGIAERGGVGGSRTRRARVAAGIGAGVGDALAAAVVIAAVAHLAADSGVAGGDGSDGLGA